MRKFQSTLPVWGATVHHSCAFVNILISIHAPRVGSDEFPETDKPYPNNFNPRSPCGERLCALNAGFENYLFQSTLPVWGATADWTGVISTWIFQSTLPVWGATLLADSHDATCRISIHAPRVGSDQVYRYGVPGLCISIHAPRVGSDVFPFESGENDALFQSTLPVWGATPA